jgi:hypothetical protein
MKRQLPALGLVALFALLSWRGVVFAPGHVYQNWDNVTPPYGEEVRRLAGISKHAWNPLFDLGSAGSFGAINRWFDIVVRDGAAPFGGTILAKWQGPAFAVIGAAGILALCRLLGLGRLASLAAALLYAFNPRQYSLAVSGHLQETGFALALVPWCVWLLAKASGTPSRRRFAAASLAAGLLGGLVCSASPFGIIFFGAFCCLFTLAEGLSRRSVRPLLALAIAGVVVCVLHLYWIVPAGLSMAEGGGTVKYNQTVNELRDNYVGMYRHFSTPLRQAALGHTDNYGMGTEYAYPVNLKETPVWAASAASLAVLALLGLTYRSGNRGLKWFAAFCLLAGFLAMTGGKTLAGALFYEKFLGRVSMVFYLMARPARWLPLYYAGLALMAGMGLAAVSRRTIWRESKAVDAAAVLVTAACLAVYLAPYWNGSLAIPKSATTQTMALMPQPVSPAEGVLTRALSTDPADYRVTVWPTIAGPTGDVPAPPKNAVTRNFAMLGKDAVMGPTFIGEPFSRYLLTVLNRPWPTTDHFGRLLGLAAVKRVLYDPSEPYLSYGSFGWMPTTKRGPETLFDPGDLLPPFVAAQTDLRPDPGLVAPPVRVLENADFLPRLRLAPVGRLAAGGFPLLLSLANAPEAAFADEALFFGSTLGPGDANRLGPALSGLASFNRSWPELLLPLLPDEAFTAAGAAQTEGDFENLSGRLLDDARYGGAALDSGGKVSKGAGRLVFPLVGHGVWRLFVRAGAEPQAGPTSILLDGAPVATVEAGPLGRGLDWIDCGTAVFEPGPPHALEVVVSGRGAVVSGMLAASEDAFDAARERVARYASGGVTVAAEAEEVTAGPVRPMAPKLSVPLLARGAGVETTNANARVDVTDPMGGGLVAVEGETPGEVAFTVRFPVPVAEAVLEAYPRLFGDKMSPAFVAASVSLDGGPLAPLFRVESEPNGRWEDVYGRKVVSTIQGPATTVTVRFAMRQAQLSSQVNAPNHPMRLTARTPVPGDAVLSFGAAARLPAVFEPAVPVAATYRATLRLIGRAGDAVTLPDGSHLTLGHDGATTVEAGEVVPDASGRLRLALDGPPGAACDQILLTTGKAPAEAGASPAYTRLNPGRYRLDLPPGRKGLLLFAESFHPGWRLRLGDREIAPIRGLGFLNAFPLPPDAAGPAELVFREEALMARLVPVTEAAWLVFGLAALVLCLPDLRRNRGATDRKR